MTSDRQIAANRQNALRSTGPTTPEGLVRSARNSVRHGVLGLSVIIQSENPDEFRDLLGGLMTEFDPHSEIETALIERIASIIWRERRLQRAETALLNSDDRSMFEIARDGPPSVTQSINNQILVGRYQTMLGNQLSAALRDLFSLRIARSDLEAD